MTTADDVISVRIPHATNERIEALVREGPRTLRKAALIRDLIELGLQAYRPEAPPPPAPAADDPEWAPSLRRAHAAGLTTAQIAERLGLTLANTRTRLHRLGLRANRGL